jgi:hypothetical protein
MASLQLGDHATDDVHRMMFQTVAGGLVVAAVVLQVVRFRLRWRRSRP